MIAPDLATAIARLRDLVEAAPDDRARSPAPASRPNAAFRIFARPAGSGPRTSRSRSTTFWPARRCATNPGAGASPWRIISAAQSRAAGHRALASLYRAGKVPGVITQNIDNLHQASGIAAEDIVELHGNTTYATCLDCGERYELPWVRDKFEAAGSCAPDCGCGGYIKTATVSFGQAMPADAMRARGGT